MTTRLASSLRPSPDSSAAACPPSVAIHTQGCKLNQADSEALARRFALAGFRLVDSPASANVFVLNTCTVTAAADAKARQALGAARRANPRLLVVAAGCYAQRAAAELAAMEPVSLVVDNTRKEQLVDLVLAKLGLSPAPSGQGNPESSSAFVPGFGGRTRAAIKIQEGCNQVCTYCIVPRVRGRERSVHPDALVQQVAQRALEGVQEVVLTGTQLGSYGFDISGASLAALLRRILKETAIPRLRVSSLQAQEISPELLALWQDPRLCPHFHLPLQSGSDAVLAAIHRRYDTACYARSVELIRRAIPGAGITADLIVGFPGESSPDFAETCRFIQAMNFSDLHVFPYSARPGTAAARLPGQVAATVKAERKAQTLSLAQEGFAAFRRAQLGQSRPVLWELAMKRRGGNAVWSGLTDNYIRVYARSKELLGNTITQAQLISLEGEQMLAEPEGIS